MKQASGKVGWLLLVAFVVSGCMVRKDEREEALGTVGNLTSKAYILRLAGEPDKTTKPDSCKAYSDAKEEIVYLFEYLVRILNKRIPQSARIFCLNEDGKVVHCCGFIAY